MQVIFTKSTVDWIAHFISLHILLIFFFFLSYFLILFLHIFIYSLVLCFIFFTFFALSIERTCPDLHFTTDYTMYDYVCDE